MSSFLVTYASPCNKIVPSCARSQRQLAFDNVNLSTSIFAGLYSTFDAYEEEQAVPTGLDSLSHGKTWQHCVIFKPYLPILVWQCKEWGRFTKHSRPLYIGIL